MDEVAVAHRHAVDVDGGAEIDDVDMGVAGPDLAGQELEPRGDLVEIADRAVGDAAETAEALMDGGLHLAPEGAEAGARIEVLDHHDARPRSRRDIFIVGQALRSE